MNSTLFQRILLMPPSGQSVVLLDEKGVIKIHNTKNLDIPLSEGIDFINFLVERGVDLTKMIDNEHKNDLNTHSLEGLIKHPNGIKQWMLINVFPFLNETGDKNYFIQLINIDHYKNSQLQLDRQRDNFRNELMIRSQSMATNDERMTGQPDFMTNFFRGLRHDIKSPLSQLIGLLEYAKTVEKESKKKQITTHINACLAKLQNTAKSLSDFVDVTFLATEKHEIINLEQLTQDTLELLKEDLDIIQQPTIHTDFSTVPTIFYNRKMLKSIFYNLIENAIKFRKEDQQLNIQLASSSTPSGTQFQITDNGIGIDLTRYGSKLFQPATRLTTDRPGAGNGLSLVKSMLVKTGDEISANSQAGEGMTFTILFKNQQEDQTNTTN